MTFLRMDGGDRGRSNGKGWVLKLKGETTVHPGEGGNSIHRNGRRGGRERGRKKDGLLRMRYEGF